MSLMEFRSELLDLARIYLLAKTSQEIAARHFDESAPADMGAAYEGFRLPGTFGVANPSSMSSLLDDAVACS